MKKNIYTPIIALILGLSLTACDKFLDEVPDARTELDSPEKVQELLATAYPNALYADFCETMSDNAGDKVNLTESSIFNTQMYSWETNNEYSSRDTPPYYFYAAYAAVANANYALEAVEKLGGGSELNYLKGEALVARAYAHFMLGLFWCKPYNPATATSDLGLPYATKAERKVFEIYKRIPLKDYYDAIEKDLTEGISLIDNSKYTKPNFHFTKEAAHAFASRFYLIKGDWDKVIAHANEALGSAPANKLRDVKGQRTRTYAQQQLLYASSDEPANALIVGASSKYERNFAFNKYGLTLQKSEEVLGDNKHPLNAFRATWAFAIFGRDDYRNIPKYQEYFKYTNVSAGNGYVYDMAVLISYDEVFLNRLEAYLMKGEKAKFLTDLVVFLKKKTMQDIPDSFVLSEEDMNTIYQNKGTEFDPAYTLSTQQREWLQAVADVRRATFVFEGLRWIDNKRLGMKVVHVKRGQTMELLKNDPRRELQIPEDAVSNGITVNPR
ncbi:RagB/SusD family nutrient uptake outer membrane protein [Capnocytophaga sp. G1920]|uniref:RagB/SusD family nutrient uptake outer membrane protein n=1 Tax=Capnocytophaga sp. G1920 TaxID=3448875 RepID=UPI003EDC96D9